MSRWDNQENGPMRPGWWDTVDKSSFLQSLLMFLLIASVFISTCAVFYNLTCEIQRTNRLMIEKGYQKIEIFSPKDGHYVATEWQLVDQNASLRKVIWEGK